MLRVITACLFVLGVALVAASPIAAASGSSAASKDKDVTGTEVLTPTKHDVSPALASIAPKAEAADPAKPKKEKPLKGFPQIATGTPDGAVQSAVIGAAAPSLATSFDGIGQGQFGFTVQYAPPDTNGAVGPSHFVETVNVSFAVFNKSGGLLYGPTAINTLFTGFGGLCETTNDGDPTVIYDQLADRWVIQQFAVTGANGGTVPYLECIAVSKTGDPMGAWNRYSYNSSKFPDYPKLGVWPDAYYMSTNDFNGNTFAGASLWAFDRVKMLAGDPTAAAQVAHLSSLYGGLLPSSLDGKTPPPAGAPDYFMSLGTSSSLYLWKFHVDFANVVNSTVTGPASIAVAGYTQLCSAGACVPQAGTTQKLDSLGDRLMYRLAYRNFGDHESLVVTHSVAPAAGGGGVRWYEVRNPSGTPLVYQQSTYAPADTKYRWMPSAAMDQAGNIGVGYTESSSSTNPSIYYTGRLAADPLNTMQPETLLMQGTGSQTATLSRWGDYSSMFVDPSDDCTFWYTSEYLTANGTWNWHTRIGTFKFGNCLPGPQPAPTVSSVSPVSGSKLGGTTVSINGTNFQFGATATFGSAPATNVTFVSSSKLTATTPSGTPGAAVNVVVTNPDAQSASCTSCYTYLDAPTVTAASPTEGPTAGGTSITITGTNFAAGQTTVSVGSGTATNVSVTSSTTLTATTPSAATAGAAPVVVTVDRQPSNNTVQFTYVVAPGPVISNVQASAQRRSASITWTTDVSADSQVDYGTTAAYGSRTTLNTTLVINHSVSLSGLLRATTYYYRVYSRNGAGQLTMSRDFTFTTR